MNNNDYKDNNENLNSENTVDNKSSQNSGHRRSNVQHTGSNTANNNSRHNVREGSNNNSEHHSRNLRPHTAYMSDTNIIIQFALLNPMSLYKDNTILCISMKMPKKNYSFSHSKL